MNTHLSKISTAMVGSLLIGTLTLCAADTFNITNVPANPPSYPPEPLYRNTRILTNAPSLAAPLPAPFYPIDNAPHWVSLVIDNGAKLQLEDGSIWDISLKDQFLVRNWMIAQKVTVTRNANPRYPFKLNNARMTADAQLVSRRN